MLKNQNWPILCTSHELLLNLAIASFVFELCLLLNIDMFASSMYESPSSTHLNLLCTSNSLLLNIDTCEAFMCESKYVV